MVFYPRNNALGFTLFILTFFSQACAAEYIELDPPFVVNLANDNEIKFAQISTQVRVNGTEATKAIETHNPAIRHAMVMLLSSKAEKDISSRQGKEQLRIEAAEVIRKVLEEQHVKLAPIEVEQEETEEKEGETPKAKLVKLPIQDVFFTRFIIQ